MPPASLDLSKPPLVTLIAGPTASGKSALALKMARETGAVIINADSQQLYADLRILTARPSPEDEALADHRLYGVADAAEAWSVGQWSRAALTILDELRTENRPAVLVGAASLALVGHAGRRVGRAQRRDEDTEHRRHPQPLEPQVDPELDLVRGLGRRAGEAWASARMRCHAGLRWRAERGAEAFRNPLGAMRESLRS